MLVLIKRFIAKIRAIIIFPLNPFIFLYRMKVYGYHEIVTVFEYDHRGTVLTHGFRTLLQLDADIVDFIPPVDQFLKYPKWRKLFFANYALHKQKITDFERSVLSQHTFWGRLFDGAIYLTMFYQVSDVFVELYNQVQAAAALTGGAVAEAVVTVVGGFLLRRYGKKYAIEYAKKGGLYLAQKYIEKRMS